LLGGRKRTMTKAVGVIIGVSLVFSLVELSANPYGHHAKRYGHHFAHKPRFRQTEGWYEHDANKLPFGSAIWRDQMLRENRRNPG